MSTRGTDRKIDNIEFNVGDIARSKAFYGGAFGWTFVDYGPTYTEFSDGRLTGGFTTGEPVRPGGPLVIVYADHLDDTQQRLKALGPSSPARRFRFRVEVGSTSGTWMDMNWRSGRLNRPHLSAARTGKVNVKLPYIHGGKTCGSTSPALPARA